MTDPCPGETPRPRLNASLAEAQLRQQAIGAQLRRMFEEVVSEPIPDSFLEILRRAEDTSNDGEG